MMGGCELRRALLSSEADRLRCVMARRVVGRVADGAAPPPMIDSPSMSSVARFVAESLDCRCCAR